MTVNELLNIKFTLYGRVWKGPSPNPTSLIYWLGKMSESCKDTVERIRNREYRLYKEGKVDKKEYDKVKMSLLPACTPSALFGENRIIGYEKERTGIIIIDIDHINDVEKCKKDVMQFPFVFFSSLSVSGAGVFCGVYYNKDNDIEETFLALQKDFQEIGYYIDPNCKDITRCRFASYDSNILFKKPNTEIEMYNKTIKIERKPRVENYTSNLSKNDLRLLVCTIYCLVDKYGYGTKPLPYSETTIEYDYDCWMMDGYRLSNIGRDDIGLELYKYISRNSNGYKGEKDVEDNFYKFQKYSLSYVNIGYYFWLAKEILGQDWKNIVKSQN